METSEQPDHSASLGDSGTSSTRIRFSVHTGVEFRSGLLFITRRVFTTALSLIGLAALAGFSRLRLIADAMARSASDVAKPISLPDMALGPANALVTITEYASMTCPHCAAFNAKHVSEDQVGIADC
jgi:hypothetical protein